MDGKGGGGGEVHEHPGGAANSGNPVDEFDVYVAGVVDSAVDGGVDEEPESEGELVFGDCLLV